jgi:rsbT co-antagonist protein RsbR
LTGLSAEVAQTLVRIGVDLGKVRTTGNLQDGIVEANKVLGTE